MEFECRNIIIGRDFNLVLDVQIDREGGLDKTHTSSRNLLIAFMEAQNIIDIWRVEHPDTK